jgi:glycosyltransferase involved in cell wall biosynthesis
MRLLFHYPVFNVGGAEKSTLRMLRALADRGHRITLVLTVGGGSLEPELDPRIEVVCLRTRAHGERFLRANGVWERLRQFPDLAAYCATRAWGGVRMLAFLGRQYDAGGTLLQGTSTFFLRRIARAKVKVHWIRSDLRGADASGALARRLAAACSEIDAYIGVSRVARDALVALVPRTAAKARIVYNILDAHRMRSLGTAAVDPYPAPRARLRVLTVCRLNDKAKALLRMVRVHAALAASGYDFDWYLVGDGPDRDKVAAAVRSSGLEDRFHLVGGVRNPFPYYRHADLVAMLSNYEGLCGVVNEAKVMGKPVLATEVSGIREQIEHGRNGWVVANDETAIAEGLQLLLDDSGLRTTLANDDLPPALLDDEAKLDVLEAILGGRAVA